MSVPEFPRRDPEDPAFWDLRYDAGFAPWETPHVPARLREFVGRATRPRHVLVPGCGAGPEVAFLAELGWDVLGIDFSQEAIRRAHARPGPHADRVRLGDFFAPIPGEPFEVVYERTFLCALPRKLWQHWGERMAQLVEPGGTLAGFFYFDQGQKGPPFALHDLSQLDALLGTSFERVADAGVEDSIDVFRGKERWQEWRRN